LTRHRRSRVESHCGCTAEKDRKLNALKRTAARGYTTVVQYQNLITIDPNKRSGQPCIRDLRMTVQDVLEYLASGMTSDEILADFPDLTADDIRACLAFAADRERRLRVVPIG
jgi:uncharacterized protein (DUF433 family)